MRHIHVDIEIDAPPGDVWPFLAEFRHWPTWGPSIRAVESEAERVSTGASGRVQTVVGLWLPFVITEARHEDFWHWKVAGLPATRHSIAELGGFRSRVEFTVPGLLVPYVVVLRTGLSRLKALAEQ